MKFHVVSKLSMDVNFSLLKDKGAKIDICFVEERYRYWARCMYYGSGGIDFVIEDSETGEDVGEISLKGETSEEIAAFECRVWHSRDKEIDTFLLLPHKIEETKSFKHSRWNW